MSSPLSQYCGTVSIEEKEYKVRRLTLEDFFVIIEILADLSQAEENLMLEEIIQGQNSKEQQYRLGSLILKAITRPKIKEKLISFLAGFIDIDAATFKTFPLYAASKIIRSLIETGDIHHFFADIRAALDRAKTMLEA